MSPGPEELAKIHDDFMDEITDLFPDSWHEQVARNASTGSPAEDDIVAYLRHRLHGTGLGGPATEWRLAGTRPDWNTVTKAVAWAVVVELGSVPGAPTIPANLVLPLTNAAVEAMRGELFPEDDDPNAPGEEWGP